MQSFVYTSAHKIVCENGAAAKLAEHCAALNIKKPLLVTDKGLIQAGIIEPVLAGLSAEGFEPVIYSDIVADPPQSLVEAAVDNAKSQGVDGVIGLGGGSSMDVAKLIAILCTGEQPITDMYGIDNVKGGRLPLILIPTTAGTGSEVTPISIITTGETTKSGVVSAQLLPDIAILDATLTVGLPGHITAATGIDAMVHAIEAFTSKVKKNLYSDMLAKEALRLLSQNLLTCVKDGSNLEARSKVLLGAMLAGQAFANAPVAAVHALAYPLGGNYHIPHGLSNALVLPFVLRFNAEEPSAAALYGELLPCICNHAPSGDSQIDCLTFIETIEALLRDVALPRNLAAMNIDESDLPKLASEAMLQQRLLVNNPRPVAEADALAIYQAAYS
ncbi:iron-containing alcohol dehydrogenase [Alteromonas lipolytica]|uniref:Alcohol dehydrogenase n=1 Tax=Alteromonas lipolytica TaxID=1856405 RepID=A0A1E8FBR4_9ALTE|nr:iron-containing alcohol dehydrogenase [Alteromonas lipolytica]OFI33350.1 alcohol dehydrogenase [Alteromonas lipolytica]GGF60494.1 iron-containing alcohol dehydrogenase [Alteromonas lipolytica]